jgi:[ribosomal protein S5]-alanine N-acetyltransferase
LLFSTPRLELVAATARLARAGIGNRAQFSALLAAEIPPAWPPDVLAVAEEYLADQLEKGFATPMWWSWYAVTRAPRMLIGSFGLTGIPDSEGTVTLGYSIVSGHEGKGYCTEMVAGFLNWLAETGRVNRVHATTFEGHGASARVLEKNGFICKGVSSEDAAASEGDRQGRGRLMLFVRPMGD